MKRTDTIFKTITTAAVAMAITAGPAFGSAGPSPSPNSFANGVSAVEQGYSSVNATLNEPAQSVKSLTLGVGHSSVNASLNESSPSVTTPKAGVGHSSVLASVNEPTPNSTSVGHSSILASVNEPTPSVASAGHSSVLASVNEPTPVTPAGSSLSSIVGAPQSTPVETATVVHDQNGFDWTDAFVGAMGALTLALLSVAAVHTLRRRERMSLGSQV